MLGVIVILSLCSVRNCESSTTVCSGHTAPFNCFSAVKRSSRFPSKCDLMNHKCKILELLILVSLNALLIMTYGKITSFG